MSVVSTLLVKVGADTGGLTSGLSSSGAALGSFAKTGTLAFAALGGAAASFVSSSVQAAADFEASFSKIENLVGVTGEALDDLRAGAMRLGAETGAGPQALADALFVVTSAGLKGAEALRVVGEAADASTIGLGDTAEIARAVTAAMNAYGTETLDAATATRTLRAIVKEGNLEASELAPTLGRVIATASQLGISFQEVGANIATFTRLGVNSAEAVTGLRSVMTSLIAPSEGAVEVLASAGLTADELRRKAGTEGLQSVLALLADTFGDNIEALQEIVPNARAFANVMGTAGSQGDTYAAVLASINDLSQDAAEYAEALAKAQKTTTAEWNRAAASLKETKIILGKLLIPSIREATTATADWLQVLSSAVTGNFPRFTERLDDLAFSLGELGILNYEQQAHVLALQGVISKFTGSAKSANTATRDWTEGQQMWKTVADDLLDNALIPLRQETDAVSQATGGVTEEQQKLIEKMAELRQQAREGGADELRKTFEKIDQAVHDVNSGIIEVDDSLDGIVKPLEIIDDTTKAVAEEWDNFVFDIDETPAKVDEVRAAFEDTLGAVGDLQGPLSGLGGIISGDIVGGMQSFLGNMGPVGAGLSTLVGFGASLASVFDDSAAAAERMADRIADARDDVERFVEGFEIIGETFGPSGISIGDFDLGFDFTSEFFGGFAEFANAIGTEVMRLFQQITFIVDQEGLSELDELRLKADVLREAIGRLLAHGFDPASKEVGHFEDLLKEVQNRIAELASGAVLGDLAERFRRIQSELELGLITESEAAEDRLRALRRAMEELIDLGLDPQHPIIQDLIEQYGALGGATATIADEAERIAGHAQDAAAGLGALDDVLLELGDSIKTIVEHVREVPEEFLPVTGEAPPFTSSVTVPGVVSSGVSARRTGAGNINLTAFMEIEGERLPVVVTRIVQEALS